jgi:hypothetical protein
MDILSEEIDGVIFTTPMVDRGGAPGRYGN